MYIVTKYDSDLKEFTVKYHIRIIKEDGMEWVDQYGNCSKIEHVKIKMIQDGATLHQRE